MMQQHVLRHRLKKRKQSWLSSFWDVANAFPSMSHDTMDAVCREQLEDADAILMKQRHRRALVLLTTRNSEIILVSIGCGGMQGDGPMPDQFGQKYNELLDGWIEKTPAETAPAYITGRAALPEGPGPPVHVGIGGYADDTTRTSIITDPKNMSDISNKLDAEFDIALGKAKMKQNAGKKELMVHFQGPQANEYMQTVHTKQVAYKGTAKKQVRYLGGWPAIGGSNQQEVDMRIEASKVGWFTMGKMWSSNTVWCRSRLLIWRTICSCHSQKRHCEDKDVSRSSPSQ